MTKISPEAQQLKLTLTRDTLDATTVFEKRAAWESAARLAILPEGVKIDVCQLQGITCEIHTCQKSTPSNSVIAYLHGGGLVEGSVVTAREWCSRLAKASMHPVLAIDYSLAPEHPYPAAMNEVVAVCEAIVENSTYSLLSIGADSTGCVLALGALIQLRDNNKSMPSSCFLLSPSIDLSFSGNSITDNADRDLIVSYPVLAHYAKLYANDFNVRSPEISPLFADLHKLPPALMHADESELLLDDAVRLEKGILNAGGIASLLLTRDLWHAWPTWGDFPESRVAIEQIVKHIARFSD